MNKKIFLLLALCFALFAESKGMNNVTDSQKVDSLKIKVQESMNTSMEIVYLDSMLHLAQAMDSTRLACQTMTYMARNYYNRMNADSLMFWGEKAVALSLEHEFFPIYFDAFSLICSWELYEKDYDSALDKANQLYQKAKDLNNTDGMIASYETIGLIYMETFRYVEAIKSFKEGLSLQKQQEKPRYEFQFQFLSYIIESYLKLKDYLHTEETLTEAYALVEECKSNVTAFPTERCLWLLNCYHAEMFVSQKMPVQAEKYIQEAKQYEHVDDFYVFCYYHIVSSSYYMLVGDYNRALNNVNTVLHETGDDYLPALKLKAELLLKAGKEQEAAVLYHKSVNLIDSTYNESLSKQINQLRTIHEVDKLELKNKQMELESSRMKLSITLVFLVVLLIALIVVIIHSVYLKRVKRLLERSDEELKRDKEKLLVSEKALSLAKEKAEANNRFKDEYLFNLSREIKTPLDSIIGFSHKLGEIYDNEETKEYVSIIKNSSDLLLKLVNDTICVSLLQTDQTPFVLENIEINQFCQDRIHEVESKVAPGVALNFRSSTDRFILQTDAVRLKQLLDILLSNAAKFTKEGEITLLYLVSQEKGVVQFIVEDTGVGIPKDIQERVFNSIEIESSENVNVPVEGVSLGMAICKIVANRLEGTITLDTLYEKGTRIIFTHPIRINNYY